MGVKLYRKKPVVIEAIQYKGNYTNEIGIFLEGVVHHQSPEGLSIETLEGTMLAAADDWIIKGVAGEFYPCKPDIFEATYEEVE